MKTPCYHCEKRTERCHTTCEGYIESAKKHQAEKEIQRRNSDEFHITERYGIDKSFKIQKQMRDRRRK